jgi:hypothetical protein
MAKLIIYEEFDEEETIIEDFELIAQRILIGSGPDNGLVLEAIDVAPAHASLELRQEQWVLQDLGSPTGTHVNGRLVEGPLALHDNDLIALGSVKIRFHTDEVDVVSEPIEVEEDLPEPEVHIKGRVWFAAIAGSTVAIIFIILFILIVADYLGVLRLANLLPWFG